MGVPFTDRIFKVKKRIFFLLLLAAFSLNLFCQQDSLIVHDSTYIYRWDSETNDWVGQYHTVDAYDANGNNTVSIRSWWDYNTNDWLLSYKEVSYWSELTTSISSNIIELNYIVYPNPFTDYTTIELSDTYQILKIELIDIHGRTVRSINNINSNSITIYRDNLPSGIYFIRIQSDDTYVKKVIIR